MHQLGQKWPSRRACLLGSAAAAFWASRPAWANDALDPGGLTFRDFAVADNGASFIRGDHQNAGGPNQVTSKILAIDRANSLARIRFESIKMDVSLPLGWQCTEDWERGVGYSSDKRYRLIVWRVDFVYEGVKDAEHYAATKSGSIRARRPTIQAQARRLKDGSFLVVYEGVPANSGDSGPRTVFDLVMTKPGNPKEGALMTLGVPAADADRGLKLLALVKQSLRVDW
jgi:hypothetical protein